MHIAAAQSMRKIPAMPITSHAESKPEVSTSLPISRLPTPEKAPDQAEYVTMTFEKGVPTSVNGKKMKVADVIRELNNTSPMVKTVIKTKYSGMIP